MLFAVNSFQMNAVTSWPSFIDMQALAILPLSTDNGTYRKLTMMTIMIMMSMAMMTFIANDNDVAFGVAPSDDDDVADDGMVVMIFNEAKPCSKTFCFIHC